LQDATGTLVQLELEAMGLDIAKPQVAVQYVDHNLLQTDFKNVDDHLFLYSAAQKFGLWYSRPGNGVSHQVHMERFGIPGMSLVGSDLCAAPAEQDPRQDRPDPVAEIAEERLAPFILSTIFRYLYAIT
jgi:homoaconitase/3-isopropylmalate dehydratase large subunit